MDVPQSPRPLISSSAPPNEFGDLPQSEEFLSPFGMDRDLSYVPGFSEMRRNRDLAVAEYVNRRRTASDVPTLPVNLRWARAQKTSGAVDNSKLFVHSQKGYRTVNAKEMAGKVEWLAALPPGSEAMADGTIRRGDTVLMVCDQQQAARNERQKRQAVDLRLNGVTQTFANRMAQEVSAEKVAKSAPTITKDVKDVSTKK